MMGEPEEVEAAGVRWKMGWRVPGKRRRVGMGGTAFQRFPPKCVRKLRSLAKMGVRWQSKALE